MLPWQVFAAFGSHCGAAPFSPWIFAFDAYSIQLTNTYTQPPASAGSGPGIWQSGAGAALPVHYLRVEYSTYSAGACSKMAHAASVLHDEASVMAR